MLLAPSVKVVTRLRTSPLISREDKPNVRSKSGKLRKNADCYSYIVLCTVQNKIFKMKLVFYVFLSNL
jgi:hypothetical protein